MNAFSYGAAVPRLSLPHTAQVVVPPSASILISVRMVEIWQATGGSGSRANVCWSKLMVDVFVMPTSWKTSVASGGTDDRRNHTFRLPSTASSVVLVVKLCLRRKTGNGKDVKSGTEASGAAASDASGAPEAPSERPATVPLSVAPCPQATQ